MDERISRNIEKGKLYCQRVTLDGAGDRASWQKLFAALREARRKQAGYGEIDASGEFPFSDIIIKDNQSTDQMLASSLSEELEIVFANSQGGFACASYRDNGVAQRYAFFGHGVFAPIDGQAEHSADLQFSWHPPDGPHGMQRENILQAGLQSSENAACAWHTGQKGIAIGFSADIAPATLELPGTMSPEVREAFRTTFLFIGRAAPYANPEIELLPAEGCELSTSVSLINVGGVEALLSGEWVQMQLTAGSHSCDLWCRYQLRTGNGHFRVNQPSTVDRPVLAVRGFLMPEISFRQWFGGVNRWFVHFDSNLSIKYADFSETRVSAIRQSFKRLAVYNHQPNIKKRWEAGELLRKGIQKVNLDGAAAIEIHPFPGNVGFVPESDGKGSAGNAGKAVRKELKRFYRSTKWVLVRFSDCREIGFLEFGDGIYNLKCAPLPLESHSKESGNIGIDWLNRMAQMEVNSALMGAALYWASRRYESEVERVDDGFKVKLSGGIAPKPYIYTIGPYERGMLGPLYVENTGRSGAGEEVRSS